MVSHIGSPILNRTHMLRCSVTEIPTRLAYVSHPPDHGISYTTLASQYDIVLTPSPHAFS